MINYEYSALCLFHAHFSDVRLAIAIAHDRYINILTWLRGFQDKLLYLVLFSLYPPSLLWELRDKSLGAMLEYWYTERGLLLQWLAIDKT